MAEASARSTDVLSAKPAEPAVEPTVMVPPELLTAVEPPPAGPGWWSCWPWIGYRRPGRRDD